MVNVLELDAILADACIDEEVRPELISFTVSEFPINGIPVAGSRLWPGAQGEVW